MADDVSSRSSAAEGGHGTHGKGDGREQRVDEARVQPATKDAAHERQLGSPEGGEALADKLTSRLSDASFGDAASGGSTIDKRPPGDKRGA